MKRKHLTGWVSILSLLLTAALPTHAHPAALEIEHHLDIELIPRAHMLIGRDAMSIRVDDRRKLVFALSERIAQLGVEVDGKPRTFKFTNSELEVPLEHDERRRTLPVLITYEAVFNDPVPIHPLNTDNPGFGVLASITEAGTFLLAGAGWYPDLIDGRVTFPRLRVKAPEGILAVTAGVSLEHAVRDGATVSEWRIDHPLRGLALSAAAYQVREQKVGDVVAATYFLPPNQHLAPAYLDAIARYVKLYSELFGPYPFQKFAVVENFFPTGYGFPSYTLLGGAVLRLPFILTTSLGHEIAHCWWGNGVFVDYEYGNWSEALTTYVSDYLYQEQESPAAAKDYRLQALRNYTTLVPPARDFPLARFANRVDPATKAVGYDKGMMVFHMLRRAIGEEAFWGALQDIYRERLFQPTGWDHFRSAFERRSNRSLEPFFDQWVNRKGAPRIQLADIQRERTAAGWRVTGRLAQEKPFFSTGFELSAQTRNQRVSRHVNLSTESAFFDFLLDSEPAQIIVDPDAHSLRRLGPSEVPPTVNALKASSATLLVVCGTTDTNGKGLSDLLANSLGLRNFSIVLEAEVDRNRLQEQDVILVGYPRETEWLRTAPASLHLEKDGFSLAGGPGAEASDAFFGVFTHPYIPSRVLAIFLAPSSREAESAVAKITHYGRYSYLIFRDGQNRAKGSWEPTDSPILYRWEQ
jgi:hypothetical protein